MIEHYAFGQIRVDGTEYRKDVKIYPDGLLPDWWREEGHELRPVDIPELADKELDHLVVGCGAHGVLKVSALAEQLFEQLGLPFTALPTAQAVEEFNKRLAEGQKVGGVFHLTC